MAQREFQSVRDLIPQTLANLAKRGGPVALGPLWTQVAGEAVSRHVRLVGLEGDTLILAAATAQWKREVRALEAALLTRLAAAVGAGVIRRLSVDVP